MAYLEAKSDEGRQVALKAVTSSTRRNCKIYSEFLPEAAIVSEEFATTIHRTTKNNLICRYHGLKNRTRVTPDGVDCATNYVGVAYPPTIGNSKGESQIPEENHGNCGCPMDAVLYEFYIFKTTKLVSSNPKMARYSFHYSDPIHPTIRGVLYHSFMQMTGLRIGDLFDKEYTTVTPQDYWVRIASKCANRCLAMINSMGYSGSLHYFCF